MIVLDRNRRVVQNLSIERPRPERFSAESRGLAGRWGDWITNCRQRKIPDTRGLAAASGNATGQTGWFLFTALTAAMAPANRLD
jgi:hypothetical protein